MFLIKSDMGERRSKMAINILGALYNAEHNLKAGFAFQKELARQQLHNSLILLEKGYSIYDEIEPLLERYGKVEDVPEKRKESP